MSAGLSPAPANTDWNAVAITKLATILGPGPGQKLTEETLAAIGLQELRSSEELRRFGEELATKGALAAAIGGMLTLHATLYGGSETRSAAAGER